jgi:hypothetical protein
VIVQREMLIRDLTLAILLGVASAAVGCAVPQADSRVRSQWAVSPSTTLNRIDSLTAEPARPLPFKGQLVMGELDELPPAVELSLSKDKDSPVTFAYREELSHDDYHIPLIVSAFDPVTYVGAPLGDYGVKTFASLTIEQGDRILGEYVAKAYVSRSYSLYSQPTHREVEQAARIAVRTKIDQQLELDRVRLAHAVNDVSE